jgi:hypothetical protein
MKDKLFIIGLIMTTGCSEAEKITVMKHYRQNQLLKIQNMKGSSIHFHLMMFQNGELILPNIKVPIQSLANILENKALLPPRPQEVQ